MARKSRRSRFPSHVLERSFMALTVFLAGIIPLPHLYQWAEVIGKMTSCCFPRHRRRILANLDLAFGAEKTDSEKQAIFREFNVHLVRNFLEMDASAHARRRPFLAEAIRIRGQENLEAALHKGKGVIGVSGHFGNFTIIGIKMRAAGYRFHTVIREFDPPARQRLYAKYRHIQGGDYITTHPEREALKRILNALRKNEVVLFLTDENRRHDGVFVPFFNRLASTAPGPALLHLRTGAEIVPMFLVRQPDNTQELVIEPALKISIQGDREETVKAITALITDRIEAYVRTYPAQWLWTRRRWRTRPAEERSQGTESIYREY